MKKFTARYKDGEGAWIDVFPGLTGDYEWARKVAESTWNRNGQTIPPEMMRVYEVCENESEAEGETMMTTICGPGPVPRYSCRGRVCVCAL